MRIVALEEHVSLPEMLKLVPPAVMKGDKMNQSPTIKDVADELGEIGEKRLKSMDDSGISVQVLSVIGIGANQLNAADAPAFASKYNDTIAEKISVYPARFYSFAHLPMKAPVAAAAELKRTVDTYGFKGALINGMTNDEFLDDEKFVPVLGQAEDLGVPIYLHPGLPPKAVADAYYSGLSKPAGDILSPAGWGWHSETAIHILRLIVSGTLDKFPKLKIIIGHMGEMLPMMMARCDTMFTPEKAGKNKRSVSDTLRAQVYITTSGIFTPPPFIAALNTFGIDNILFSVDYPFAKNELGKKFINSLQLDDIAMEKLVHGNADKLLKLPAEK